MLDHKHKLIFVHIPRTSGSSIERSLNIAYTESNVWNKHLRASDIRRSVSKEIWDTYYKFSIVRNPFDRVISLYSMQYNASIGHKSEKPLSYFLEHYKPAKHEAGFTCSDYIDEDLDYVGQFEHRAELIDHINTVAGTDICNSFKFDPDKTRRRPYADYYQNFDNVKKVVKLFKEDFERFGYDENISI